MKAALIAGVAGQDGFYLAEFLLQKAMRCAALNAVLLSSILSILIISMKIIWYITIGSICTM